MNIPIEQLEKAKILLRKAGISDEKIDQMFGTFDVFYEFNDYLKARLNLSDEEVQDLSNGYTKREIEKRKEEIEKMFAENENIVYEVTGDIMVQFAIKHEFPNPERIKTSLLECIKIMGVDEI